MRLLNWQDCYNVRDLGGYPTGEGGRTRVGVVVRSANLCRLTSEGREALVRYGVRTIIDLRWPGELAAAPHPFANGAGTDAGVRYLNLPLTHEPERPDIVAAFQAAKTNRERYCLSLDHNGASFARILESIADAREGAVVYHCHAGRDRTGIVTALLLRVGGVPDDIIVEDYALSDRQIGPLNEAFMNSMKDPHDREQFAWELAHTRETMRGLLTYLDAHYGGARAFLRRNGMSQEALDRLKGKLVEPAAANKPSPVGAHRPPA